MKYPGLPAKLFIQNRYKLQRHLQKGSLAIITSNKPMPRNGDQFYTFRQSSDFYYLTGITQERSVLLLFPEHPVVELREILFLAEPTEKSEMWEGIRLRKEQATEKSGIKNVRWLTDIDGIIEKLIGDVNKVYYNSIGNSEAPGLCAPDSAIYDDIQRKYPSIEEGPVEPLMKRLRMIKEPEEISIIRDSAVITGKAFHSVLKMMEPGMMEYEIEALINYEFLRYGAEGPAYDTIVASGINALTLHYIVNNGSCKNGELILLDFGADLGYYASDCSRTIPVSGKFSSRQKELYRASLRVLRKAISLMTVGKKMADFHQEVGTLWEKEHVDLGLYTMQDISKQDQNNPCWKKYYWHGTSHSIGIDVHDPFDKDFPFQPGMILSCEPGLYIREEGVGIRLENDILISEEGPVDLTAHIPVELEEIESLMAKRG